MTTWASRNESLPRVISDVARELGVSTREYDYWCRKGHIRPVFYGGKHRTKAGATSGSGRVRRLPDSEVQVLHLLKLLTRAGLQLDVASKAARELQHPNAAFELADGVYLFVSGDVA